MSDFSNGKHHLLLEFPTKHLGLCSGLLILQSFPRKIVQSCIWFSEKMKSEIIAWNTS